MSWNFASVFGEFIVPSSFMFFIVVPKFRGDCIFGVDVDRGAAEKTTLLPKYEFPLLGKKTRLLSSRGEWYFTIKSIRFLRDILVEFT